MIRAAGSQHGMWGVVVALLRGLHLQSGSTVWNRRKLIHRFLKINFWRFLIVGRTIKYNIWIVYNVHTHTLESSALCLKSFPRSLSNYLIYFSDKEVLWVSSFCLHWWYVVFFLYSRVWSLNLRAWLIYFKFRCCSATVIVMVRMCWYFLVCDYNNMV